MKKWLILCAVSLSAVIMAEDLPKYEIIPDTCGLSIETPGLSKRQMRKLQLENGLKVLILSDPETHESGAAMAVAVGSWDDPVDRPGMAHFVEHLLFLGTEKYPEEEGYTRYLDEHGGNRNAYTMADRTVYIFSVNNDGFLGALDRFGQFFIAPLFNPSGVDRECKAIHQEFCRDLPMDGWRMLYVKKELANNKHPFHSFCIGNMDTLEKISQDELKQWYATHYSSNLMHLVVYSDLDIDTLEKEVVTLFSHVKNNQNSSSNYSEPLLEVQTEPKLCVVTPVQELQVLELTWEIPRFYGQDREIHADKLLSHVLGHEGSTSLLAQLKRENLAESLAVGNYRAGKDQCMLSLTIELTTKGVQEYEKVIERCFGAIATLQQSGIPRYIFDEVCQIEELRYRFQSRKEIFELVSEYASKMIDEPLTTYPRCTLIPSSFEPEKIKELVSFLTPQTCFYTLAAPENVTKLKPTQKEKWMGVDYALVPIATNSIKKWEEACLHMAMSIPRPNPFIPNNLKIKNPLFAEKKGILPTPELISDEPTGKIYAAIDNEFLVPEISWIFTFKTPFISDAQPTTHALADLYCHSVNESLKTSAYEALMGGLSYSLQPKHGALELKINGYSDKATELLKAIVSAMQTVCPTHQEFVLYKDLLGRDYSNTLSASALKEGGELLWSILFKEFSGLGQKNTALKKISHEQLSTFCQQVLSKVYIEGLMYGNITLDESRGVWQIIKDTIPSSPYPVSEHPNIQLASLPSLDTPSYLTVNSKNPANAVILTIDCGNFSFKRRAAQEILTKGLEEPFFSELRTRQQTAYVVTNWSQELERHLYSFFAIQSSSHATRDLLSRFELFIESSLQHLKDKVISQERFESIRSSYIKQLQHPAENLKKMGGLLHTFAFQYDGDFEWMEKRIKAFEELTYDEFVELCDEFLGKGNTKRLAINVNGNLTKKGSITYHKATTKEKLRNEICYEGRRGCQKS